MTYTKIEGKLFHVTKEIKEVTKELTQLIPYIEKKVHRERLEAIRWKLDFSILTKEKKNERQKKRNKTSFESVVRTEGVI